MHSATDAHHLSYSYKHYTRTYGALYALYGFIRVLMGLWGKSNVQMASSFYTIYNLLNYFLLLLDSIASEGQPPAHVRITARVIIYVAERDSSTH